ncbi:uncharacterized protein ARMOST_06938 [Armillaria ostoyae]|uniref:SCA7 domain-containing protein n=1 Tax=Armillaria ostoyae TaxID=47428 RepID=A0A284R4C7_ARMOS|nr:uncharacterized protein ARMOST_06938 [Armillaria ostoyae]
MSLRLKRNNHNSRTSNSPPPFSWDAPVHPPPADLAAPVPPTAWLPYHTMKIFGAQPLTSTTDLGVVRCKDCEKPILRSCFSEHSVTCANIRRREAKAKADAEMKSAKKRKASLEPVDPSQPPKKKSKPATKVTKGRVKGPVDFDRQCGVINDKGLECSRSLTCKSHSMGAKRAVQGRSRPYDELLLDWQRANNPNFVEPVKRESKAEKKEKREKEKLEKKRLAEEAAAAMGIDLTKKSNNSSSKKSGKKSSGAATGAATKLVDSKAGEIEENLDDLDSEAEVDTLINSIRVARKKGIVARPLAVPCDASSWFVQRRERARCCRELLAGALGGRELLSKGETVTGLGMTRTASMGLTVRQA